ncbi:hypothetical protein F9C07_11881 [Aspergillus flavus]|uniref:Elongation factor 3 four helical bundle domain-containing protein n=1 Tax=Aspergillus flavus (strain ATCC 200026 / FGSC A1120 / IAM 13836 / NRRL 3357 / JCM 12722 / SRRC 167) TaxID=332952 RepID=A0A7U2R4N7_ASPFN|nr:hypothetical protein F9C07_11881 [Aspergillus flavus]
MGAVVFAGRLWGVFSSYPNPTRGPSYGYISLFQSRIIKNSKIFEISTARDSSPKARKQVQNPNAVLTYVGAITDQLVDEKIVETVTWTQKDSPCITGIAGEDKIK